MITYLFHLPSIFDNLRQDLIAFFIMGIEVARSFKFAIATVVT